MRVNLPDEPTLHQHHDQRLAQIERERGFLEAAQLSEAWIRRMSERALLLEAHHTTHIEGTKLTFCDMVR